MIVFSVICAISTAYSFLYAVRCFRLSRIRAAIGALLLSALCLAVAVLLLYLLFSTAKM